MMSFLSHLQHSRPCCIGHTNSRLRFEFVPTDTTRPLMLYIVHIIPKFYRIFFREKGLIQLARVRLSRLMCALQRTLMTIKSSTIVCLVLSKCFTSHILSCARKSSLICRLSNLNIRECWFSVLVYFKNVDKISHLWFTVVSRVWYSFALKFLGRPGGLKPVLHRRSSARLSALEIAQVGSSVECQHIIDKCCCYCCCCCLLSFLHVVVVVAACYCCCCCLLLHVIVACCCMLLLLLLLVAACCCCCCMLLLLLLHAAVVVVAVVCCSMLLLLLLLHIAGAYCCYMLLTLSLFLLLLLLLLHAAVVLVVVVVAKLLPLLLLFSLLPSCRCCCCFSCCYQVAAVATLQLTFPLVPQFL